MKQFQPTGIPFIDQFEQIFSWFLHFEKNKIKKISSFDFVLQYYNLDLTESFWFDQNKQTEPSEELVYEW